MCPFSIIAHPTVVMIHTKTRPHFFKQCPHSLLAVATRHDYSKVKTTPAVAASTKLVKFQSTCLDFQWQLSYSRIVLKKKILDKQDDIIMGEKSKKEINMEKLNRALMR